MNLKGEVVGINLPTVTIKTADGTFTYPVQFGCEFHLHDQKDTLPFTEMKVGDMVELSGQPVTSVKAVRSDSPQQKVKAKGAAGTPVAHQRAGSALPPPVKTEDDGKGEDGDKGEEAQEGLPEESSSEGLDKPSTHSKPSSKQVEQEKVSGHVIEEEEIPSPTPPTSSQGKPTFKSQQKRRL